MDLEFLRKLNLSEGEIRVYDTLLEFGEQSVQEINERLKIERRNIYDILNKLIERGFVSYIVENKKKIFKITPPEKIISYLDERQTEIEEVKDSVKEKLGELEEKYHQTKAETNAQIFRGKEGMKAVWNDFLSAPEMHWIGSGRYVPDNLPHFFTTWNKKRIAKNIIWHNLLRDEFKEGYHLELEYRKFLPKEFTENPTVIGIYGDKVVNLLFFEEYYAIVIENKKLADSYRKYHKYLWENIAKE